jgi:hypothetical protein
VVGEEAVRFRHELLRQAVEGSLSPLARRELNRRVLEALAGIADRRVDLARLVHHAREAGHIEAVLRYGPEAARQAAGVAAHREAVGHYRVVLAHAERIPPPVRVELLEGYSVEAYLSGLSGEAVSARQPAVDLREAASDRERLGETLRWLSRLHWWDGNRPEAEAVAGRAIAVLEPDPDLTVSRRPACSAPRGRAPGHPRTRPADRRSRHPVRGPRCSRHSRSRSWRANTRARSPSPPGSVDSGVCAPRRARTGSPGGVPGRCAAPAPRGTHRRGRQPPLQQPQAARLVAEAPPHGAQRVAVVARGAVLPALLEGQVHVQPGRTPPAAGRARVAGGRTGGRSAPGRRRRGGQGCRGGRATGRSRR